MTINTVTGERHQHKLWGALGGSASGTAATVSPTATSVAVGGGGGGGGAAPKDEAATVTIGDSSSNTSAKMAAAHGLRGLDLTTREGREEATHHSQHQHGDDWRTTIRPGRISVDP